MTALDPRSAATSEVRGIGAVFAAQLAAAGIHSAYDLLWFVPRRYLDFRNVWSLASLGATKPAPAVAAVAVRIERARSVRRPGAGRHWIEAMVVDPEDPAHAPRLCARWFGMPQGFLSQLQSGAVVTLAGGLRRSEGGDRFDMANPQLLKAEASPGLQPVYGAIEGIAPGRLRRAIAACAAQFATCLVDETPAAALKAHGLPPLREAFAVLHDPMTALRAVSDAQAQALQARNSPWHRRLLWSECFALGVRFARERARLVAQRAPVLPGSATLEAEIRAALPFEMTPGQQGAYRDIAADLARPVPMRRILIGDVGSGKTAVAFAAMMQAVRAGYQAALLVPTEVLAVQHATTLQRWAKPLGVEVAVLTGSMTRQQQTSVSARLRGGALPMVVGTHALLDAEVRFARLGLYIVDEQHRFGVVQRNLLATQAATLHPHGLVMSATPIPRSLALTMYGELDPTWLRDRPTGRQPPRTELFVGQDACRAAWQQLAARIADGARGFVVCPAIDGGGNGRASIAAMERLLAERLPAARIAICHGQLAAAERQHAIARLAAHEVDVVLATTVIEVGVDVPEATFMVIVDAETFGVSTLHQLRGRVGRGGGAAWCLLMARATAGEEALDRLHQVVGCHDGFALAEADLAARGPGAVLGRHQAGLWRLQFTDWLADAEVIDQARRAAEHLVATPGQDLTPLLAHATEWFADDALDVL